MEGIPRVPQHLGRVLTATGRVFRLQLVISTQKTKRMGQGNKNIINPLIIKATGCVDEKKEQQVAYYLAQLRIGVFS